MRIDDQAIHCIVEPEFCDIGNFFLVGGFWWMLVFVYVEILSLSQIVSQS